jgi:hypothetical protein
MSTEEKSEKVNQNQNQENNPNMAMFNMMSMNTTNNPMMNMDKEKLFETFMMFQQFMMMNQNNAGEKENKEEKVIKNEKTTDKEITDNKPTSQRSLTSNNPSKETENVTSSIPKGYKEGEKPNEITTSGLSSRSNDKRVNPEELVSTETTNDQPLNNEKDKSNEMPKETRDDIPLEIPTNNEKDKSNEMPKETRDDTPLEIPTNNEYATPRYKEASANKENKDDSEHLDKKENKTRNKEEKQEENSISASNNIPNNINKSSLNNLTLDLPTSSRQVMEFENNNEQNVENNKEIQGIQSINPSNSFSTSSLSIKVNDIKINLKKKNSSLTEAPLVISDSKDKDSSSTVNKPFYNPFDDVPIKSTNINFLELLERNLANMPEMPGDKDTTHNIKKSSNIKPKKSINISKPTETKKYKYYSDNFDKDLSVSNTVDNNNDKELKKQKSILKSSNHTNNTNTNKSPKRDSNIASVTSVNISGIKPKKPDALRNNNSASRLSLDKSKDVQNPNSSFTNKNKSTTTPGNVKSSVNNANNNSKAKGKTVSEYVDDKLNFHEIDSDGENPKNLKNNKENELDKNNNNNINLSIKKIKNSASKVNKKDENIPRKDLDYSNSNTPSNANRYSIGFNINNNNSTPLENKINNNMTNTVTEKTSTVKNKTNTKTINIPSDFYSKIQIDLPENIPSHIPSYSITPIIDKSRELSDEEEEEEVEDTSTVMFNNVDAEFLKTLGDEKEKSYTKSFIKESDTHKDKEKDKEKDFLNAKLKELNFEIQKLKAENDKVSKLKHEYEKLTKKLTQELFDLNERKEKELREIELIKEEELRKILKERKLIEKSLKNTPNFPSRKEKDEIEALRAQLQKQGEDFKLKDNTNKLMIERLKKQLDEANFRIVELTRANSVNSVSNSFSNANYNSNNSLNKKGGNANLNSSEKLKLKSKVGNVGSHNSTSSNTTFNPDKLNSPLVKGGVNEGRSSTKSFSGNVNNASNSVSAGYDGKSSGKHALTNVNTSFNNSSLVNKHPNKDSVSSVNINTSISNSSLANKLPNKDKLSSVNSNTAFNVSSGGGLGLSSKVDKDEPLDVPSSSDYNFDNETEEDNDSYDLVFPDKYHGDGNVTLKVMKSEKTPDGKLIRIFDNDKREVIFPSGVRKEIYADGYQIVYFTNNDIKQVQNA